MTRRALVIGSQTYGLAGVHNDVETMTTLLEARGFDVHRCVDADATRVGILDAYERLIADTRQGDTVVGFYSGHGARGVQDSGPDLQFIVPFDYDESKPDDFRGITSIELSVLLARLTERTDNCAFILDCCHAAHMSRDGLYPKALPHPTQADVAAHIDRMKRQGLRVDLPHVTGNELAVRIVACRPDESAYEFTSGDNRTAGLLTDSLRMMLGEAEGLPVSWASLMAQVRRRVLLLAPTQRPEAEGPSRRLLFETAEASTAGALQVVTGSNPNRIQLPGARLLGVEVGDEFTVMPAGAAAADESTAIGRAKVERIGNLQADGVVELRSGRTGIPLGALAYPVRTAGPRWPVDIVGTGEAADQLRAKVSATLMLRVAEPADRLAGEVLAEVTAGDTLSVRDAAGPLVEDVQTGDAGQSRVLADLALQARARNLRLRTPAPGEELAKPYTVEWGRVVDDQPRRLPPSGAVLHPGEKVYFRLRNDSDSNLYFFLFNLGVDHSVTLVTATDQSGLMIEPHREYVVGQLDYGELTGVPLGWPSTIPNRAPRPDAALVIVTSEAENLAFLAQDGVRNVLAGKHIELLASEGSDLQRMFVQDAMGGSRNIPPAGRPRVVRYAMSWIDFQLDPAPVDGVV